MSQKEKKEEDLIDVIKSFAFFIALALFLRASVVEAFKIPSSSMEPTLQIGDHILVNKLSYGARLPFMQQAFKYYSEPKREDVIVFTLPDDPDTPDKKEDKINIIKRVIGLGGDVVEVKGSKVYINGKYYEGDERFARWAQGGSKDFGPEVIPEGHVLMLGDNRDHSKDSRFWKNHYLDIKRVKGKAFLIYWNWPNPLKRILTAIR